jgi:voltage-gated potassium channel
MTKKLKEKLYTIVFESDTQAGKIFDLILLIAIGLSVFLVMFESVPSIYSKAKSQIKLAEWIITALFTAEYFLRIYIVRSKKNYIFSFYGIIDLLAILPGYISLFIPAVYGLSVIRAIRMLRIFRILKLTRYISESRYIGAALLASKRKIGVFLFSVLMLVTVLGAIMYIVESPESGFTSIPQSIYWSIVTLTTVGYGDIAPATVLGKMISSLVMIIGYSIIAVPTGIVTSEIAQAAKKEQTEVLQCANCGETNHNNQARYCHRCGEVLR